MKKKNVTKKQAVGEIFSYEGDSDIIRVTFQIPTNQMVKLSPIKQGDLFGLINLSNDDE